MEVLRIALEQGLHVNLRFLKDSPRAVLGGGCSGLKTAMRDGSGDCIA